MKYLSFKKSVWLIFGLIIWWTTAVAENTNGELYKVISQITNVKTDINQKQRQQSSVQQQLDGLKKKINVLAIDLRQTAKGLKQQKNALAKLMKDQKRQENSLKDAQDKLSAQINLAYRVEHPSYFKIILSKNNKINPSVILVYHRYVFMARLEQMRSIKKTIERLEHNKKQIKQQALQLEKLEKKQEQQKIELEAAQKERDQLLGSLKNKIAKQRQKLKQLLLAKRNLERLIDTLVPHKFTLSPVLKNKFCRNFIWPTKGEIVTRFGSPIEQSSWRWNGVVISAAENQEVRAVSAGKVVYADWLNGYGLLLIIDHGSGYMSLYGYNSGIRKKLHAEVASGEAVASVGMSGDEKPELYFAIRYNGKPVDPEKWCR